MIILCKKGGKKLTWSNKNLLHIDDNNHVIDSAVILGCSYVARTLIWCSLCSCIGLQMLKIIVVDRFHLCMQQVCTFRIKISTTDSGFNCHTVPKLSGRRLNLKLAQVFKIVHGLCYFLDNIFRMQPSYSNRLSRTDTIYCPFARTIIITLLYRAVSLHGMP